MHPLTYNFAYHVDSTTLADGDYELIPNQAVEVSEDLTLTLLPPTLRKKASLGHNPLLYLHCNLCLFIYTYALCLEVQMEP
jgi:hypothetical protein